MFVAQCMVVELASVLVVTVVLQLQEVLSLAGWVLDVMAKPEVARHMQEKHMANPMCILEEKPFVVEQAVMFPSMVR